MNEKEGNRLDREVDILDLLAALNAGKKLIVIGTLFICILAAGISYLIPEEFEATVQLLPPKEQKQGFGFSDLLSALPIPSLRLGEKGTPADIFVATLKSPTTHRHMVNLFSLMERYEVEKMSMAIEILNEKTVIDMSEEGTIMIAVLDTDPQRAADIANHYVAILDSTNKSLSQKSAAERLRFIRRLKDQENAKLEDVMQDLQEFQAEHNAISIEDQARAVIGAAAKMQTDAMELEIARQSLIASGLDESHAKVKKLEQEFILRQQALIFLRDGLSVRDDVGAIEAHSPFRLDLEENLFLPLRRIPEVALSYAKIEKNVLVQKALMQLLLQQEAEAMIEADNNTSTVQVLDHAIAPEEKARPRRFLIVFVSGVLSLFASIVFVLGRVYVRVLQERWRAEYQ